MRYTTFPSPIGELLAVSQDGRLRMLHMQEAPRPLTLRAGWERDDASLSPVREQLEEYFAGARHAFELDLDPVGNAFERRVWDALLDIPYGETASYGDIARRIGAPDAARAVGAANGRNPIAVIIPCHRVIGASGKLVGYGGGLERKRQLLELESGILALA